MSAWLLAVSAVGVGLLLYGGYRVSADDRAVAVEGSYRFSEAIATGIEVHLDETLRDARNAVYSATLLLQNNFPGGGWQPDWLHRELNRELSDHTSIARMVVASADGRVIASSRESSVPTGVVLPTEVRAWHDAHPASTEIHLGVTRASLINGKLMVPYSQAIFSPKGTIIGFVVAELDFAYFVRVYERQLKGRPAIVRWIDWEGRRLMGFPLVETLVGIKISTDFPAELLRGPGGRIEFRARQTGRTSYYSLVPVEGQQLTILVGQDRDAVLADWEGQLRKRAAVFLACLVALIALVAFLYFNLLQLARNEEKIGASEAQLRALSDNVPGAVLYQLVRERGLHPRIVYISASIQQVNGLRPEDVLNEERLLFKQIVEEDLEIVLRARRESAESMTPLDVTVRLRRADGQLRWMRFRSIPRLDSEGTLVWNGIELDVTESVLAAEEVRKLNTELESRVALRTEQLSIANRNLEAFAYSVAHDLRAPLHRINGFAALLRDELHDLPAENKRHLQLVGSEALRMGELIDGLLILARAEKATVNWSRVDMHHIAREVYAELEDQNHKRAISFKLDALPAVRGDGVLLRQVLVNLLGNAVKFTRDRDPAEIEVGARFTEEFPDRVVLYVKDNGAGFDPRYASRLFGTFQRLHSQHEFEGHGIGLALVRRIIERHGGRIWGDSDFPNGATFSFTLPLDEAQSGAD